MEKQTVQGLMLELIRLVADGYGMRQSVCHTSAVMEALILLKVTN